MRSPEVSPSSLDVVIAPVICWQKRGTEKIWRLGKTSTHAALVFNGQHIGLPSREWRFKSATLLHARLMDDFPRQE